jgi:hypothetical protein
MLQTHGGTKLWFWTELEAQLYPRLKDNLDSKSNEIIIEQICLKVKSRDLIRLLIGQFDLVMGPIKGLIKFTN